METLFSDTNPAEELPFNDVRPLSLAQINTRVNFIIACDDQAQADELKALFGLTCAKNGAPAQKIQEAFYSRKKT